MLLYIASCFRINNIISESSYGTCQICKDIAKYIFVLIGFQNLFYFFAAPAVWHVPVWFCPQILQVSGILGLLLYTLRALYSKYEEGDSCLMGILANCRYLYQDKTMLYKTMLASDFASMLCQGCNENL